MSSRDDILNRIRAGRSESKPHPGSGPTPKRGQVAGAERKALFVRMAQQAQASVDEARSRAQVPEIRALGPAPHDPRSGAGGGARADDVSLTAAITEAARGVPGSSGAVA